MAATVWARVHAEPCAHDGTSLSRLKSGIAARCGGGNGPDDTVDDFVNAVVAADSKACSYLTPDGRDDMAFIANPEASFGSPFGDKSFPCTQTVEPFGQTIGDGALQALADADAHEDGDKATVETQETKVTLTKLGGDWKIAGIADKR
jgi:hypothetical protein